MQHVQDALIFKLPKSCLGRQELLTYLNKHRLQKGELMHRTLAFKANNPTKLS